jgi:exopolysaccharide biosynthesis polyprenyl glycosylphosphotransferase
MAAIAVTADALLINLGFALSWYARYEQQFGREILEANYIPYADYFPIGLILTAVLLCVFGLQGLYGRLRESTWLDQMNGIFGGTAVGIAIMIVGVFYSRPFGLSRLLFIYALGLIIVLLAFERFVGQVVRASLRRRGIGLKRVLVVGAGSQGLLVMQNFVAQPHLGYSVVGFLDDSRQEDIGRFPALGTPDQVREVVSLHDVDEVIIALPSNSHQKILEILGTCEKEHVAFSLVPDFYELSLRHVDVVPLSGIPLIGIRKGSIRGGSYLAKRFLDAAISLSVIAVLSPLLALIALLIKLDSDGPVLFKQVRVGRGGRPFVCYKFRSMRQNADKEIQNLLEYNEAQGPMFKMRSDPRCTRVGRVLRRLSFDEIPQFFNILRGDMSVVGPRPPLPHEVEKYEDWHKRRLETSPGLTGLWQVGGRSNLTFDEMALLDIWYIENWSLSLDVKVMLRTAPAILFGTGAY